VIRELILAAKLKKAAEKGRPLVLAVYPDGTFDLIFPERVFGDAVEYFDPRRGELRTIVPRHILRYGRVGVAVVPSGFLESIGFDGLALLALPRDAVREVQAKLSAALAELARRQPEQARSACEALGLKVLPLYAPEELSRPEVVREVEALAREGYLPLEDAVEKARSMVESSLLAAAKAATVLKRSGAIDMPTLELCSALERAAEVFHVKPEEILLAERLRALARLAAQEGRLAYYRKRPELKKLLAVIGVAAAILIALLLLPSLLPGPPGGRVIVP